LPREPTPITATLSFADILRRTTDDLRTAAAGQV
jgi:hypothetical protein